MRAGGQRGWAWPQRLLLSAAGIITCVLLGIVGVHLHGAVPVSHLGAVSAAASSEVAAAAAPLTDASAAAGVAPERGVQASAVERPVAVLDSGQLGLAAACVMALLITIALLAAARRGARSWLPRTARPRAWSPAPAPALGQHRLHLRLSIIRV
ncbi:hypothetical protein EV139_1548 [Leucobacter luti]|uniref:Uncharacterized protein n=1 Tax=Leucobacter luti TaxID=340320 RepID=A0A4Q7U186_9MICO|nr:hypothetical protein EV139_1548 [Leucobacter luti]